MLLIKDVKITKFQYPLNNYNGVWNYEKYTYPIQYNEYQSEISFIPGFSDNSQEEIENQFKNIDDLEESLKNPSLSSSIKFALSHLYFQKNQSPLEECHLNKSTLLQIDQLKGCKPMGHIKIKIGRGPEDFEIEQLRRFLINNPTVKLRLDANQSFSPIKLQSYWDKLESYHHQIDYFEEPFKTIDEYENIQIPIAHDELVQEIINHKTQKILIIKPSFFGDYRDLLALKNTKHRIILSHCYEGEKVSLFLNHLASYWLNETHGLS